MICIVKGRGRSCMILSYPKERQTWKTRVWSIFVNPAFSLNENIGWWVYRRLLRSIEHSIERGNHE